MAVPASARLAEVVPLFGAEGTALSARSDDELMRLARAGRKEAFDVLIRRHQTSALKVAVKFLGEVAAARDAAQNTFVEIYRALPRYQTRGEFIFYLRRVLLNQCRMAIRGHRIKERAVESFAREPSVREALPPDDLLLELERRREVDRAIARLSEKLRETVVLRYTGGHSLEETAQILEVPLGTVKSRLFAAMDVLRAELGDFT